MSSTSWYWWWLRKQSKQPKQSKQSKQPKQPKEEAPKSIPAPIPPTEVCPLSIGKLIQRLNSENPIQFSIAYDMLSLLFPFRPEKFVLPEKFQLEIWGYEGGVIESQIVSDERVVLSHKSS